MTPEDLHWFHSIPLGDGRVTPGTKSRADQDRKASFVPASLVGKRVLDVGARDGFYSFLAETRGAAEVVALEPVPTAGFHYARAKLRSGVKLVEADFMRFDCVGEFDVVICFGVLYHVPDPSAFLRRLVTVAGERLCLETAIIPSVRGRARLHDNARWPIYRDTSTYFVPTAEWVRARLKDAGARIDEELCWIGGRLGERLPPLRSLPSPQRFFPSRHLLSVRTD